MTQQQPTNNQMMGYDRSAAMFSPDGRLLQVEYAKKAVKQGSTSMGIICKDGVVLIADKRILEKLIIAKSIEKIIQIDDHIGASATGYLMDGRVLIERAQLIAQQHKITYDSPIDVLSLVKEIADVKQYVTQMGGARPFGVSILFAGVEDEPKLFVTDVTGIFFEYKATAIGEAETELKEFLDKNYKDGLTIQEGVKLGITGLKTVLGKDIDTDRLDVAYIKTSDKLFKKMSKEEIKKLFK